MDKEERKFLTVEQALNCLIIKDNQVHNLIPIPFGLVEANWNIEDVKEYFDSADSIEIGGEQCRKIGHGIAVIKGEDVYFFEADNNKLDLLDKEE